RGRRLLGQAARAVRVLARQRMDSGPHLHCARAGVPAPVARERNPLGRGLREDDSRSFPMQRPRTAHGSVDRLPIRYGLRLVTTTSVVMALLLAVTATAGLLFGARGLYRPDPATLPAFLGQD